MANEEQRRQVTQRVPLNTWSIVFLITAIVIVVIFLLIALSGDTAKETIYEITYWLLDTKWNLIEVIIGAVVLNSIYQGFKVMFYPVIMLHSDTGWLKYPVRGDPTFDGDNMYLTLKNDSVVKVNKDRVRKLHNKYFVLGDYIIGIPANDVIVIEHPVKLEVSTSEYNKKMHGILEDTIDNLEKINTRLVGIVNNSSNAGIPREPQTQVEQNQKTVEK